jgi:hypothetical protein
MSEHRGLIRKMIYLCGIAVLLVPLVAGPTNSRPSSAAWRSFSVEM